MSRGVVSLPATCAQDAVVHPKHDTFRAELEKVRLALEPARGLRRQERLGDVVLGLSGRHRTRVGGALAVEAIRRGAVHCVSLPSRMSEGTRATRSGWRRTTCATPRDRARADLRGLHGRARPHLRGATPTDRGEPAGADPRDVLMALNKFFSAGWSSRPATRRSSRSGYARCCATATWPAASLVRTCSKPTSSGVQERKRRVGREHDPASISERARSASCARQYRRGLRCAPYPELDSSARGVPRARPLQRRADAGRIRRGVVDRALGEIRTARDSARQAPPGVKLRARRRVGRRPGRCASHEDGHG